METKDLNSIGLAYLQMVEKRNTEAKKNHAKALHKNQKALDVHSDEDEDHNDDPTDGDGDIDAADLKKLRDDADKDDKKFDKKKKSSKKDDGDDQEKFKAYTGDDKNDQEGTKVSEDKEDKFEPHMMYDPKTGKGYKAKKEEDHLRMKKMGYTHDKPEEIDEAMTMVSRKPHPEGGHIVTLKDKNGEKVVRHLHNGKVKTISKESVEIDESTDLQEGAARQAALAKGLMDYCKEIGKDHMDHKDFADHAKHVKAGNWDKARAHANDQDTEVREKIHTLAIDHLGQGAASELYGGDRKLSKNKGDGKLHASYNESVNVDDVLALIDQGYTLDQAEAMVAEACGGGGGGGMGGTSLVSSRKHPDGKKLLKASRKQPKAGDNDRNMANNQRSIPAKGADTAPVRPGTKQQQRDFDKAARMAKSKDKVSVAKAPWESVEVDEGYGSMVSPKDRARIKARVNANMDKLSAKQLDIAKQTPPRYKITRDDFKHLRKHGHANSPQKESVMDRVSNMVEDIRVDIQEKKEINEGPGDINNPMKGMPKGGWQGSGPADPVFVKTMSKKREKELRAAGKLSNSANNASHYAGEAVQNVNELSPTTKQSYLKKADKASTKSFKKADDIEDRASDKGDDVWSSKSKASQKHSKLMHTGEKRAAGARLARKKLAKESVQNVNELDKKTLGSYVKKAVPDMDTQRRFATEYEKRGMAAKNPGVMDKNFKKANRADDKVRNRRKGINTAIDKMAKESVQEAAKPTAIHHSTPVTAAQANDEQTRSRWTDKAKPNTMTEKEFVDMHTIHPDVLPEFDGNVAAKKTAEAIKKAPKAMAKTPNTPTSKGDQNIMPDPTPYGGPAVKTESYMDKYAKYIRGEI